jgi:pimeloyl-ACP methyl ester carboxylesterase
MKTKFYQNPGLTGKSILLDYGSYTKAQLAALIPSIGSMSLPPHVSVTVYAQDNQMGNSFTFSNPGKQFLKVVTITDVFPYPVTSLTISCACLLIPTIDDDDPRVQYNITVTTSSILSSNLSFAYTLYTVLPTQYNGTQDLLVTSIIVIIHDFGSRKDNYECLQQRLALNGYASIAIDQRGHGGSSASTNMELSLLVEDNRNIIQQLGLTTTVGPIVIGHGYGGVIAQLWALTYQFEIVKLVLMDSAPFPVYAHFQPIHNSTLAWLAGTLTAQQYATIYANAAYNECKSEDCELVILNANLYNAFLAANQASLKLLLIQNPTNPANANQPQYIMSPTMMLHGTIDIVTTLNGSLTLGNLIAGSVVRQVKNFGHCSFQTSPLRALPLIWDFIEPLQ